MKIPFTKAHGAKNDFLLTWAEGLPEAGLDSVAVAICDRHTGIGADGWILMRPGSASGDHAGIRLYNSDGSTSDLSGNGTRCVAAYLVHSGVAEREIRILTGAGLKTLWLIDAGDLTYRFEMDMGCPAYNKGERQSNLSIGATRLDATILDAGNPQCAVFVPDFELDWRGLGAAIERHPMFPERTNVSFIRVLDEHAIDVRFWERGAGETMSSGTGSTGAAFAAALRGLVNSPVRVLTPAGALEFKIENGRGYLTGPAELIGSGEFFMRQ